MFRKIIISIGIVAIVLIAVRPQSELDVSGKIESTRVHMIAPGGQKIESALMPVSANEKWELDRWVIKFDVGDRCVTWISNDLSRLKIFDRVVREYSKKSMCFLIRIDPNDQNRATNWYAFPCK